MISTLGNLLLAVALPMAVYGILTSIEAYRCAGESQNSRGVAAVHVIAFFSTAMVLLLEIGFLSDQFSLAYVASHSSRTLLFPFKVASLWAGSEGSLLLWSFMLALFSSFAVRGRGVEDPSTGPIVITVLLTIQAFFLSVLLFDANPFRTLDPTPLDGKGLNPLLQNALMCIHPPMLLTGYVSMAIPFAFAAAALIARKSDNSWLAPARRWMLIGWLILSVGNILGSMWAYVELGWGGFWGWDPVENAAILPWFTATAFLHSSMIQRRLKMFKGWNVSLLSASFFLTIFGTFLNRSGVVQSVHSFSDFELGTWFLIFMIAILVFFFALVFSRKKELKGEDRIESFCSRENAFLMTNLMFVLITFAVLWGTIFPIISELIVGQTITMEPKFFNQILAPIGVALLFLMGVGPLLAWKRNSVTRLRQLFLIPIIVMLVTATVAWSAGVRQWYVLLVISFGAFVLATVASEFIRGAMVVGFAPLLKRRGRRYGGYIIHIGAVCIFAATAGAVFQKNKDIQLSYGESVTFDRYILTLDSLQQTSDAHKDTVWAFVDISDAKSGKLIKRMTPAYNFYRTAEQPANEIAIFPNFFSDLYLVIGSYNGNEKWAQLRIMINPLISFLWLGGIFIILGTLLILRAESESSSNGTLLREEIEFDRALGKLEGDTR